MSRADEIKALLFDTFGTVVDWRSSLIDAFSQFGQRHQLAGDWSQLVDQWRAAYWPSMDKVRKGELAWTTLDELHRAALVKLVPAFKLEQLSANQIDDLTGFWHRLKPWPDVRPGLARLKNHFLIGPLSNGNFSLMVELNKFAGLGWDFIFGSDIFRHYKPDPETYLEACSLLGLRPAQVGWLPPTIMICTRLDLLACAPLLFRDRPNTAHRKPKICDQKGRGISLPAIYKTWPAS